MFVSVLRAPGQAPEDDDGRDGSTVAPHGRSLAGRPVAPSSTLGQPTLLEAGEHLGRYRIVRFVARGGMGEVYEAVDTSTGARLAVKTLRPDRAADARTLARLEREVQLARRVDHAHVCRVHALERHEADGRSIAFITMELLEGQTLAARVRERRLGRDEALAILAQIAAALEAAHGAGVVHRDLKGLNVMLVPAAGDTPARAVVTDFGLGLADGGDAAQTIDAGGTPAYMAPEQVLGRTATAASDIYALGVLAFELVTGTLPFVGDTPISTAARRLAEDPPSPRSLVPDLEERWERAILRCLRREPEMRFARASDFIAALAPGPMAAAPAAGRVRRLLPRAALASGAVLLATVALAWPHLRGSAPPSWRAARGPVRLALQIGGAGLDNVEAARFDAQGRLVVAGHASAPVELAGRHIGGRTDGVTFGYVVALDPEGRPRWSRILDTTRDTRITGLGFLPDGDLVVVGEYGGAAAGLPVRAAPTPGAKQGFVARLAGQDGAPRWVASCDADRGCMIHDLAVAADGRIAVVGEWSGSARFGGTLVHAAHGGSAESSQPFVALYSPAGALLWATSGEGADFTRMKTVVFLDDDVFAGGEVRGPLVLGGVPVALHGPDALLARLDGRTGAPRWLRAYGDSGTDGLTALATAPGADAHGRARLFAGGYFEGHLQLGVTPALASQSQGSVDAFVAELDPESGDARWLSSMHGPGWDCVRALAARADGSLVAVGRYAAGLDVGAQHLPAHGSVADVFVAELDPRGALLDVRHFGGEEVDHVRSVALAPGGEAIVAGRFRYDIDLGVFHFTARGLSDGFVMQLERPGESPRP